MREGRPEHRLGDPHEYKGRGGHRPDDYCRKDYSNRAQTFRRGRAISFLERLNIRRTTLLQQLNQPEYDSIKQVLSGELKATDAIIQEFIHTFELSEAFSSETQNTGEQRAGEEAKPESKDEEGK